jgi:hypothetical protein
METASADAQAPFQDAAMISSPMTVDTAPPATEDPAAASASDASADLASPPGLPPDDAGADAGAGPPAEDASAGSRITGGIRGAAFPVARAVWIGRPTSTPTRVFLLQAPGSCEDMAAPGWDRRQGRGQVLEIGVKGTAPGLYQIRRDADASYVSTGFNPEANGGTVTVSTVMAARSITGSFQLTFGPDSLAGTFDASYCPAGVEP